MKFGPQPPSATRNAPAGRWAVVCFALLTLTSGCTGEFGGHNRETLALGAYSVVREALHEGVLPAFAQYWKERTGKTVDFVESYNASGAQSRSIVAGYEADVAILSHSDDVDRLKTAGLINSNWRTGPTNGIVTHSLVVIGVRPGNPKRIEEWTDLARRDVGVLYPDPNTSGGARWNINAIFGASLLDSKRKNAGSPNLDEARDLLARVQARVINMDSSGRQSMANFVDRGIGDAVVSYENELALSKKYGKDIPYVIPSSTLLIESPIAIIDKSVDKHKNRELAEAFVAFAISAQGQRIFAEYGFRPMDPKVPDATGKPTPREVFTVKELGGWKKLKSELYGPDGYWTQIFKSKRGKR